MTSPLGINLFEGIKSPRSLARILNPEQAEDAATYAQAFAQIQKKPELRDAFQKAQETAFEGKQNLFAEVIALASPGKKDELKRALQEKFNFPPAKGISGFMSVISSILLNGGNMLETCFNVLKDEPKVMGRLQQEAKEIVSRFTAAAREQLQGKRVPPSVQKLLDKLETNPASVMDVVNNTGEKGINALQPTLEDMAQKASGESAPEGTTSPVKVADSLRDGLRGAFKPLRILRDVLQSPTNAA